MKKLSVTASLLLVFLCAVSQNLDRNRLLIEQKRNEMVEQIISGNNEAALNILQNLQKEADPDYVILYPREEMLIALATRKFKWLADSAKHYNRLISGKANTPVYNDFRNALYQYLLPKISDISEELENSDLAEEDKALIRIYLHFLFSDKISGLNRIIRDYRNEYPKTRYIHFLNSMRRLTLNSRVNFNMGYTGDFIGIGENLSGYEQLNALQVELDAFIRKFYLSLYISGGFSNVSHGNLSGGENGSGISAGEGLSSQKYGAKLGKVIVSKRNFKFYPYLSVGGFELTSPTAFGENKILSSTSLFAGAGTSCDVVLSRWKPNHMYAPEGYFFIRPKIGYNRFLTQNSLIKNDFYFSVSLGVSIGPKL